MFILMKSDIILLNDRAVILYQKELLKNDR